MCKLAMRMLHLPSTNFNELCHLQCKHILSYLHIREDTGFAQRSNTAAKVLRGLYKILDNGVDIYGVHMSACFHKINGLTCACSILLSTDIVLIARLLIDYKGNWQRHIRRKNI